MSAETIIYTNKDRVSCTGESNDHPLVYYSVPEKGFVTCGYCDLKFARQTNNADKGTTK
tara:strand:+ start:713 stop:889 length:177 start_codon:yes stop_codon:yes gene_type:complete